MNKSKLEQKIESLKRQKKQHEASIAFYREELKDVSKQLSSAYNALATLSNNKPEVTDHARLRYLERLFGLDISEIDEKILEAVRTPSDSKQTFDGITFVINNGKVVTVYDK